MAAVFANRQTVAANNQDASWKATGFLNIWLPLGNGKRHKVGAISLKDTKNFDAKLIARLQEEGGIEAFQGVIEIDFQLADSNKEIDLGF